MSATGVAITNPLVKYRALVATKNVIPDQSQLRLALHLQKLYDRLKDYEPRIEYSDRLDQIARAVRAQRVESSAQNAAASRRGAWRSFLDAKEKRDSLALTRKLTSHEAALDLDSPKGLMLHGEVGTGKSMLIDLFADCLPTRKKRRWHFNTFMLEMFAKLESLRVARTTEPTTASFSNDDDYSLLWLAKDLVQDSPILFLDEFQMPDRVASKILTNLMTAFFQLGGVLVATSNRMPEELAKATGMEDYPMPAPSRIESLGWQFGLRRRASSGGGGLFGGQNEFSKFLEVLKARCEVWEMEGGKDYRRVDSGRLSPKPRVEEVTEWSLDDHQDMQHGKGMAGWPSEDEMTEQVLDQADEVDLPAHYSVNHADANAGETLKAAIEHATGQAHLDGIPWKATTMKVYGRTVPIPRAYEATTMWTFDELCKSTLGPADYMTLASGYNTLILTEVPVLTWIMKNEARRFITLLDALYECRCKLYISAEAGPDDLFFPDRMGKDGEDSSDAVYSETIAEVYQDATAPFRPNILSENPNYAEPEPEPDYTHARLRGLLSPDAIEDDPPNKPRPGRSGFSRFFGMTDGEMERKPIDPNEVRYTEAGSSGGVRKPVDFGKTSAFTGEDERFAYKRAQSRLWEMCGARWWARNEADWHRPLPAQVRRWEQSVSERSDHGLHSALGNDVSAVKASDVAMGEAVMDESRPDESFKHGATSPFRTSREPPPKFSWTHVWGMMKWGPKAGAWGKGVEGLKERDEGKR
ncbi:hypothetical protein D0869_05268 [Hortaea werneckii]|uniref:AAA+ ATPase domain-containing protein n=2 Tax=Hortaea werneckii TaxID=91943 RepID=A0A3M6WYH7_HORWE|nr:hypothetical protein KC324_g8284 [Hortaea werneckii]KAI7582243.1 hypothetical protein KC316_g7981 [Hortaea werneckii]RMX83491.1 hypothetical protein D0869_05268 [Hortaea werneckii]RMY06556.1 hypothetical protein D0868_05819 [Hortaea werneckii]RMY20032.1 hypothetical protein D0867_04288 [Hortaea werneckii]